VTIATRLLTAADAPILAGLLAANREFLAPWEPARAERYFTAEGQRESIGEALDQHEHGSSVPHAIVDGDRIVGRITLGNIVRGPFLSGNLGYWVNAADNGRGVATAAVAAIARLAFGEWGLHRIEAGTLLHNAGSQRVLERNGFVRFGMAPRYLRIAGRWQDHYLYQALAETPDR
jgi:ribosomal-protein-alanine N-acetyltransferase